MTFLIIGGDTRQISLINSLIRDGHTVKTFGFHMAEGIENTEDLDLAMENSDCVVLPLPAYSQESGLLNAPFAKEQIYIKDILKETYKDKIWFSGGTDRYITELADKAKIILRDYSSREEFAIFNADVTAEGILQLILEKLPITVSGANILVIGYGRIGKSVSEKLSALGAHVTVSARRPSDMALIKIKGYGAVKTENLTDRLSSFDVIVNTVPALVLNEGLLREVRGLIIDVASRPGGTDFDAAKRLGIDTVHALALPGKTAPVTAGEIIKTTIYNMVSEGESIWQS